jgi:hypothetical protein
MATNIQTLLESSNEYKSMQKESERLVKKWKESGLLEGLDKQNQAIMAVMLENQAKRVIAESNQTNIGGATFVAGQGEQWAGIALPLVRKIFAQIAAKDFLSVQPMNLPSGLAFFLEFKYGTGWNGRRDGENVYGNVSEAQRKMQVNEDVKGGLYGAGQFGYTINQHIFAGFTAEIAQLTDEKKLAAATQWEYTTVPENKKFYSVIIPLYTVDKENGKVWEAYEAARFKADNVKYFLSHRMDWDKMEGLDKADGETFASLTQDKSYLRPESLEGITAAGDPKRYYNLKHVDFFHNPSILPDLTGIRAFTPCDAEGNPIKGLVRNYTKLLRVDDKQAQKITVSIEFVFETDKEPAVKGVLYHVQPVDNNRGDFEAMSDRAVDKSIEIPEIDVKMESVPIVAKTRKLKTQWTPEFAQDLNAYHSIDAEAELTSFMSEYISMELDLELLDMLIQAAVTTDHWSAKNNTFWNEDLQVFQSEDELGVSGYYNTQGGWYQTLGTKAQKISNKIHQKTLRGGATFMVTSPTISTILESIPGYAANTDGDKMEYAMGVQKVGSLNSRWQVYKNPYMTENIIFMGYKGSQFLECGAVYAPYIPLMMTPLVYDPETFTPRKGLMTRYAKLVLRPEFYGKLYISGLETI